MQSPKREYSDEGFEVGEIGRDSAGAVFTLVDFFNG
jgi:hypothetical protein